MNVLSIWGRAVIYIDGDILIHGTPRNSPSEDSTATLPSELDILVATQRGASEVHATFVNIA